MACKHHESCFSCVSPEFVQSLSMRIAELEARKDALRQREGERDTVTALREALEWIKDKLQRADPACDRTNEENECLAIATDALLAVKP